MTSARRVAFAATMAIGAAGCMTGAQTIEQDLAYQRWKRCDTFATMALVRINTDGRVIVTGREEEKGPFLACMAEEVREQRRSKPGLVAPDPIVNLRTP